MEEPLLPRSIFRYHAFVSLPILVTPSLLSADFSKLQEEVASVELFADWLQADIMDGHFVPNLSFGAPVLTWLKTSLLLDVHLMVTNPADRIDEFLAVGAKNITFHAEVVPKARDQQTLIRRIREGGATAGIALNPDTPLTAAEGVLDDVDLLLIMSVHPGFGGQEFIEEVLSKVRAAREAFPNLMIQMDGGIDDRTAPQCIQAGANNLVSGSYIFRAADRAAAIAALQGR